MAPFGEGNPKPLFRMKDVNVLDRKRIGSDKSHLRLILGTERNPVQAVAFRMGYMERLLEKNSKIDVIFEMGLNEYNGRKNAELVVKYIRMPEESIIKNRILLEAAEKVEYLDNNIDWIYNRINNQQVSCSDMVISRQELGILYRYFQKTGSCTFTRSQLFELAHAIAQNRLRMNYFKVLSGIRILNELEVIRCSFRDNGCFSVDVTEPDGKRSLNNSKLYSFLQGLQQAAES